MLFTQLCFIQVQRASVCHRRDMFFIVYVLVMSFYGLHAAQDNVARDHIIVVGEQKKSAIDDRSLLANLVSVKDSLDSHLVARSRRHSSQSPLINQPGLPEEHKEDEELRKLTPHYLHGRDRSRRKRTRRRYVYSHKRPESHRLSSASDSPVEEISSDHVETVLKYCFRDGIHVSNRLRPRLYSKLYRVTSNGKNGAVLKKIQLLRDSSSEEEEKGRILENDDCKIMRIVLESLSETMGDLEQQLLEDNKKMLHILEEMQRKDRKHEEQKEILKQSERKKTLASSFITGILSVLTTLLASSN